MRRNQPALRQFSPRIAQSGRFGDPQDDLQITQSAGAFLAVRFQAIWRVFVLRMALAHFQRLGLKECLRVHCSLAPFLQKMK
jgi:hypothetical protein